MTLYIIKRSRVKSLGLTNVEFFDGRLEDFDRSFDIGVAL